MQLRIRGCKLHTSHIIGAIKLQLDQNRILLYVRRNYHYSCPIVIYIYCFVKIHCPPVWFFFFILLANLYLAFLIPYPKIFLSKESEDWFTSCCHLRYKMSNIIQMTQKPSSFSFCFVLGAGMVWIAFILSRSISIPWLFTTNPRSFPDFTLNEHFAGFSFNQYFLNLSNSFLRF